MRALQPAHVRGNARDFPQRYLEAFQNVARPGLTQSRNIVGCYRLEIEIACDVVHDPQEPRQAVDERAVEVEDRQRIVS